MTVDIFYYFCFVDPSNLLFKYFHHLTFFIITYCFFNGLDNIVFPHKYSMMDLLECVQMYRTHSFIFSSALYVMEHVSGRTVNNGY